MASSRSFSTVDYQAWEAQMDLASQSSHLDPSRAMGSYNLMPLFPSRHACSSSRPPSMTSEEDPSPSQCISVHTPGQPGFADPQPTIDGHARDDVAYGGNSQYGQSFDLRGTSPSYFEDSTFLIEGGSTELDLQERNAHSYHTSPTQKFRFHIPGTSPALGHTRPSEEPWSSLNTRVGNSSSQLHQLPARQNGSGREQIHAIDVQHDGHLLSVTSGYNGYSPRDSPFSSPATVGSISAFGIGLSDQQHGLVNELCEGDLDLHSGMPHGEQIHAIDAQHDGHLLSLTSGYNGYSPRDFPFSSPATVASISAYGTGLPDQQHGLVNELGEGNPDLHYGMPHGEQIHAIDAQHDGHLLSSTSAYNGYSPRDLPLLSPATVASITPYDTGLADQRHGLVDELCEGDLDLHSGMPHTQNDLFDRASTATYGPDIPFGYVQDLNRPVSPIDRRSEMESNFEPDTFQDSLVLRSNQMSIIREQVPTHHDSQTPVVYGYQASLEISYRQHLDNCRRFLPYQRRGTDTRAYQAPNTMTSLTQSPDTQLVQSPSLRGAGARQGMVGPVRRTTLAIRAKGVRKGPLKDDARRHARDTRGEGSCWPCKIQRYKCDAECGSEKCFRCKRMKGSPWRWGCIRDTLPSYANSLLAASLLDQHHPQELNKIFRAHIHEWSSSSIDIQVKWAHGPPIQVIVHEFRPIGTHLLLQDQYILSQRGYERVQVSSLPVGMTEELLKDWRPTMHEYLDRIVDEPGFEKFPENCFRGEQNEVQRRLIHAIRRYKDAASDKGKRILRNSLKLLVCQKLASYSLILDERNKNIVLDRMRNPSAASAYGRFTASRFLNREIKYVVADLHRTLLDTELKNLQEALQASDTLRLSWGPAFVSVLILGIVTEVMQHLVRCKASSDIASVDPSDPNAIQAIETRATVEIDKMESIVEFTRALFNRKYLSRAVDKGKGFKPIYKPTDRDLLDKHSTQLALDVNKIISEHGEFLEARQKLGPPNRSDDPRVSRLVAEFLLSCKPN